MSRLPWFASAASNHDAPSATPAPDMASLVDRSMNWLCLHQNSDGGWGDTVKSLSNLSTTALCWAALKAGRGEKCQAARRKASAWILAQAGSLAPDRLAAAVASRYGRDRTFSVPILSMLALAGELGDDPWRHVAQLPFELAALPAGLFRFLRLQVVSYALPALIAIGQARFRQHRGPWPMSALRSMAVRPTFRLLEAIEPASGGYLEATPLTSFVLMNLAGSDDPSATAVAANARRFLAQSVRPGGCWPIDTDLATWVTTLSVSALAAGEDFDGRLGGSGKKAILDWLLAQQHKQEHPYTKAAPGGWAWTDLSGGVPDADDTAGALVAIRRLSSHPQAGTSPLGGGTQSSAQSGGVLAAAEAGVKWLLDLQNSDGGIPTFCRGWGRLAFDRSAADLTAHALAAWTAWRNELSPALQGRIDKASARARRFLAHTQRQDGAWTPLWFGNQHAPGEENPVYGTSRVLTGAGGEGFGWRMAIQYLLGAQNSDGGWGGAAGAPSSIEETALAADALARVAEVDEAARQALTAGANYLIDATGGGERFEPSPIGLYFARLWYFEELYPLVFALSALNHAKRYL